jgi:hypothetical protein
VALLVKTLRIDEQLAAATYDETVSAFIDSGLRDNSYMSTIISLQSRFAQVTNPPRVDLLIDFSFIKSAIEQLKDWKVPK